MGAAMMRVGAKEGSVGTSKRYGWQQRRDVPAAQTEFPIVPVGPDPYDDVANIKDQYAFLGAGQGGNQSNWVVPFEQADAAYLMRKRDQEEKAQFDMWVTQKYDLTDPAQNMMLQSIAPELYQRREEVIDTQQQLVSRYAKMRLRGAKSLDDLYLQWLIETNRVELPKGPIWDPMKWREAQSGSNGVAGDAVWNRKRYYAGFFSPLKWMGGSGDGAQYGQDHNANYFDITGSGNSFVSIAGGSPFMATGSNSLYAQRYANAYSPIPTIGNPDGNPPANANAPQNH